MNLNSAMSFNLPPIPDRLCVSVALVAVLASGISQAEDSSAINAMCPVLQDRPASADYAILYKGKEVRFCCSECATEFKAGPEIYENALPQLQDLPLRHQLQLFLADFGGIVIGSALLVTLIGLRVYRWYRPVTVQPAHSVLGRLLARRISPAVPLTILSGYLGFEVWSLQDQLRQAQLEDEIHYATFYDFGYPPVPRRPDADRRVAASFYRGNDERSPRLFNDGNYRTATFHLSLCDADGGTIDLGTDLSDTDLFVKLEVERPPFTPDFLYSPELMDSMFLTAKCDRFLEADGPAEDRVTLTEVEPMLRWQALFPVERMRSCCRDGEGETLRGTIYLCQEQFTDAWLSFFPKRRSGSRFHYGIHYDLETNNDELTARSDIYMGALYRTRKLPTWRVPMDEWFSHQPIPELPGENVADPELLGITDHVAVGHGTSAAR
ncbi:MAG: hypothetical protein ABGZ35_13015 [Planctomycetaceae bacterium]|jgi:YHS domain-containing protein